MASASFPGVPVLLVLLFLVINITPSLTQDTEQLIERICRQMEQYGFCSQTFKENLKSPNADILALTQITVERALDNATQTHDFIRQLLESTTDTALKSALETCEYSYRLVMEAFQSAAVAFFQKDYDSVEKSESGTPRAEASCADSLSKMPPNTANPLTERNNQMRILLAMALVSVHELNSTQNN
ncbi:hypothetical protein C1H46_022632 [Malus baccata]|uniref:Pectinesterase inhibitor domain-containing protein n=1 Tax=Malus baccata TaxID=106549 RepID=A0A540LZ63_MALBA|nr:hypothetical protein C1H46_022632 [Malus baccata]